MSRYFSSFQKSRGGGGTIPQKISRGGGGGDTSPVPVPPGSPPMLLGVMVQNDLKLNCHVNDIV